MVHLENFEMFDLAFGQLGLSVGPRTGSIKRTKDDKEWYVIRRFLRAAIPEEIFELPISIQKAPPPEPDFVMHSKSRTAKLEVTEATVEADQREMTAIELSNEDAVLIGELGGRFRGGLCEPGFAWASDIIAAINRKNGKSIFTSASSDRHLVIYPNSNASSLIFDEEDEDRAFRILVNQIETIEKELCQVASGCFVHILGKEFVFFDILNLAHRHQRRRTD